MSTVLSGLSVAIGAWIITTALAYRDWAKEGGSQFDGAFLLFLFFFYFAALAFATFDSSNDPTLDISSFVSAVILGLCLSSAYCIVTPDDWLNAYHRASWIMGGGFVGCGLEAATGFLTAIARRLRT